MTELGATETIREASGHETVEIFAHPARVLPTDRASLTALTEHARTRALDPTIFEDFQPFFFGAEISNNRVDAYSTLMAPSSLKNYAADAEAGVAFQDSHRTDGLERMLGQSLTGKYSGPQGNGVARTMAEFYTLQGVDPQVDAFIRKARAGIARDVSIGFYFGPDGQMVCSICTRDMRTDWDCWHFPGLTYDLVDKNGKKTDERAVAIGRVENAHLAETSTVYDGATPGAQLIEIKAAREVEAGRMRPGTARLLEDRYRIKIHGAERRYAGVEVPAEEDSMPPENDTPTVPPAEPDGDTAAIRAALDELGVPHADGMGLGVRALADELRRLRPLSEELERLRPLADDGRRYRDDLVADAIRDGKRAFGQEFAEETYKALLERAPIETIRRMRDDWAAMGDRQFPGGRQTRDEESKTAATETAGRRAPIAAYLA